ncbi:MAG: cytochrome-c peroxidase [Saprospiraceae bacterium]|nr:cytochrome-c peroxidase [Saprospiraceae bacterium]
MSADSTMSCASCHLPEFSFTDANALSVGIDGIPGKRSAMSTHKYRICKSSLFWDGRSKTLEEQALLPVEDPVELHNTWTQVTENFGFILPILKCLEKHSE